MGSRPGTGRKQPLVFLSDEPAAGRKKFGAGVMFGIACVASPCCTPLLVPLIIGLLAGTPLAVWLTANLGVVYGGLTLLSILSLVLSIHWWRQRAGAQSSPESDDKPVSQPTVGISE